MSKGKRYVLVEVDVDVAADETGHGSLPNNLTSDSQHCFDSLLAEIDRLRYADGTGVYGAQPVHVFNIPEHVVHALHFGACAKEIGALGKECDRPDLHHDSDNLTLAQQLNAPLRRPVVCKCGEDHN